MKKKLLLTLMMLVAATATLMAQDGLEQTAAPIITCDGPEMPMFPDNLDTSCTISVVNAPEDPDAEIYIRIGRIEWFDEGLEWRIYDYPICFTEEGDYRCEAYAIAPGKAASEVVDLYFHVSRPDVRVQYLADFMVDGIYYMNWGDGEVYVTTEAFLDNEYFPVSQPMSYCYSGDVVIPETVEYEGTTYTVTGIFNEAFMGCDITSIVLPSSMADIMSLNFDDESLTRVVCKAVTPPEVSFFENYLFGTTLFVPAESVEAYRDHDFWHLATRIVPFLGAGPGDANGDGVINVSDVTSLIDLLLSGEDEPAWVDVNGDGVVNVSDVTTLIDQLLAGD